MKNENLGLVRVCAVSPYVKLADPISNAESIISEIKEAENEKAGFILFPELALTGKSCGDLFFQEHLYNSQLDALNKIVLSTKESRICAIIGLYVKCLGELVNCAGVIQNGEIKGIVPKIYPPKSAFHKKDTIFTPGISFISQDIISLCDQDIPFGQMIFEDSVNEITMGVEINEDLLGAMNPGSAMSLNNAQIIFNPSANEDIVGKAKYVKTLISAHSLKNNGAYVYASAGYGESTQDMIFGGQCLIAENGKILSKVKDLSDTKNKIYADIDIKKIYFDRIHTAISKRAEIDASVTFYDTVSISEIKMISPNDDTLRGYSKTPFIPENEDERDEHMEEIFDIQSHALAGRLSAINAKSAVIGISGGLDSTLALLVISRAFELIDKPKSEIISVTMPGFGTTDRTYQNALTMMKSIGTTLREINIAPAVRQHFSDIGHDENIHDTTYENSQARERTQILMDIANREGGIVVGTGDLSEAALGWCTFNGDHMSMYNVNGGVPKTLVRHVVKWVKDNRISDETLKRTLQNVLDTPISPELLPPDEDGNIAQKTEDNIGPYELHDFFIYYTLRYGMTPKKLLFAASKAFNDTYDMEFIKKWLTVFYRRFFAQQFKRNCVPDGPKVGTVSLSPRGDWSMPSDAQARIWLDELKEL